METEELLRLEHVYFSYEGNEKHALEDISVSIKKGQKIAVVGSNGAGKSTFFLIMNGVLTPMEGCVRYAGTAIGKKNRNELRRHVGIVFQDAENQMIASTVQSEVSFGPMNLKLPMEQVRAQTQEAMRYMNLTEYADRPPHYLSGGEKKRVSIADVLAMKPEVILLDEPTTALDGTNQNMLEIVLDDLWKQGKTCMISTHEVDFAYRWADRVIVFSDGRIIRQGIPTEIFTDEDLLKQADLKMPVMVEIAKSMHRRGLILESQFPKTPQELDELLKK